jgi:lipoprotein signal peptidase
MVAVIVTAAFNAGVAFVVLRATAGVALLMVSVIAVAFAVLKLTSAVRFALMEFVPTGRRLVVQVAVKVAAFTRVTFAQPAIAVPALGRLVVKLTVPDGITPAWGVMVAVIVTAAFNAGVAFVVLRATVGVPAVMVSVPFPVAGLLLVSAARLATIG